MTEKRQIRSFERAMRVFLPVAMVALNTGCLNREKDIEQLLTEPVYAVEPTIIISPTESLLTQEAVIEATATLGTSFSEILPTSTPIGDPAIDLPGVEGVEEIKEIITKQKSDIQLQLGDIDVETVVSDRTGDEGRTISIYSYGREEDGAIIMPVEREDGTAAFIESEPPFGVKRSDVQVSFGVSGSEVSPVAVFYGEDSQVYWYDWSEQEKSVWRDEDNNPFEVSIEPGLSTEEIQDMGLRLEKDEDGRTIAVDEKGYPRFYLDEATGEWMVNYFSIWHPEVSEPMFWRNGLDLAAEDCQPFSHEELTDWSFHSRYYQDLLKAYGDPDIVYADDISLSGMKRFQGGPWRSAISPETYCLLLEMEIEKEGDTTETILLYRNVDGVVVKIPLESFLAWYPDQ